MEELIVNEKVVIPASELSASYSRSGGPGGQNVNKVNSKVDLRWQMENSAAITDVVKRRLRSMAGQHLNADGSIQFVADEHRDQGSNLRMCRERLKRLLIRALRPPTIRKATKPSKGSIRRRLEEKKATSAKKQGRNNPSFD